MFKIPFGRFGCVVLLILIVFSLALMMFFKLNRSLQATYYPKAILVSSQQDYNLKTKTLNWRQEYLTSAPMGVVLHWYRTKFDLATGDEVILSECSSANGLQSHHILTRRILTRETWVIICRTSDGQTSILISRSISLK